MLSVSEDEFVSEFSQTVELALGREVTLVGPSGVPDSAGGGGGCICLA